MVLRTETTLRQLLKMLLGTSQVMFAVLTEYLKSECVCVCCGSFNLTMCEVVEICPSTRFFFCIK